MSENVITLSSWQNLKKEKNENESLQEYYQLLSFDQLIGESKELRKRIAQGEDINKISLQTKFIFDEIKNRMIPSDQKNDLERLESFIQ